MARTWAETPRKAAWLRRVDRVGRRLRRVAGPPWNGEPRSILVVELWHIGDVVLSTAALSALRRRFPTARISLLAKPHAEVLLRESGLVDDFITFDFPWTAFTSKYVPWRYNPLKLLGLFRALRKRRFDASIDCRMDLRSNVLTFLSGAKRRIGYDFGGGAFLLTDAIPARPDAEHKVHDWLRLLAPLGVDTLEDAPRIALSQGERDAAERKLRALGLLRRPLVIVHPGARQKLRRWGLEKFAAVADYVAGLGADVLVVADEEGYGKDLKAGSPVRFFSGDLRELMSVLACADLLICNDSGPMHIAAALGTPVIAVFGPQRKLWYGPYGPGHRVVMQDEMPCRPCFDSCIFSEPVCLTRLDADAVIAELDAHFAQALAGTSA